jgi:hypothetical protein
LAEAHQCLILTKALDLSARTGKAVDCADWDALEARVFSGAFCESIGRRMTEVEVQQALGREEPARQLAAQSKVQLLPTVGADHPLTQKAARLARS